RTTSVPVIPSEAWKRQMNEYVPGGRLTTTLLDCPPFVTTSIPWPDTVNVCGVALPLWTRTVEPSVTVTVLGAKEKSDSETVGAEAATGATSAAHAATRTEKRTSSR